MLKYKLISFLGSFLLFQMELIVAKILLPSYGGSFYVWTTCMMFFMGTLFLGYFYADAIFRKFSAPSYSKIHLVMLLLSAVWFPVSVRNQAMTGPPVLSLLITLVMCIGVRFFVLSTTSPVIQRLLSSTTRPSRDNPYFLYSASNWGALIALFSYPFLFEPFLGVEVQIKLWYGLYALYAFTHLFCLPNMETYTDVSTEVTKSENAPLEQPAWRQRIYWITLSGSGVALMLAATNTITLDLAPVPLLWTAPLGIYLITFILNFKRSPWYPAYLKLVGLVLVIGLLVHVWRGPSNIHIDLFVHFVVLFIGCMAVHRSLYLGKPASTRYLTSYYLYIALGGWAASAFMTFGIPMLGRGVGGTSVDYGFALLLMITSGVLYQNLKAEVSVSKQWSLAWLLRMALYVAVTVGAIVVYFREWEVGGFFKRNFYGIYRVLDKGKAKIFYHGRTIHGAQFLDPEKQAVPLMYYHKKSPIGWILSNEGQAFTNIGVVGLGAGTLATYSRPGQQWDFYELDPDVADIAEEFFTYLRQGKVKPNIIIGDARLSLERVEDGYYDLLVLDAFSSDAIPVHLLTKEAIELYLSKLSNEGLLAYHISNRTLELNIVLAQAARSLDLNCAYKHQREVDREAGEAPSKWLVMSRSGPLVEKLVREEGWEDLSKAKNMPQWRVWTDDYVNILPPMFARRSRHKG